MSDLSAPAAAIAVSPASPPVRCLPPTDAKPAGIEYAFQVLSVCGQSKHMSGSPSSSEPDRRSTGKHKMNPRIAVLVVEDEALIRMAIVDELEDAGFEVFEAANADAAIAILVANLTIRLMFTDIDMPGGMDGLKLAAAVRDRWPPIKIIVTSGHQTIDMSVLPVEGLFLRKPYSARRVVQSISEMVLA